MDYAYWTRIVFFLTVPVIVVLSFNTLRTLWREQGQFPTYWACVHAGMFGVFTLMGLMDDAHALRRFIAISLIALSCWFHFTVHALLWWKTRHTKATPPE